MNSKGSFWYSIFCLNQSQKLPSNSKLSSPSFLKGINSLSIFSWTWNFLIHNSYSKNRFCLYLPLLLYTFSSISLSVAFGSNFYSSFEFFLLSSLFYYPFFGFFHLVGYSPLYFWWDSGTFWAPRPRLWAFPQSWGWLVDPPFAWGGFAPRVWRAPLEGGLPPLLALCERNISGQHHLLSGLATNLGSTGVPH